MLDDDGATSLAPTPRGQVTLQHPVWADLEARGLVVRGDHAFLTSRAYLGYGEELVILDLE